MCHRFNSGSCHHFSHFHFRNGSEMSSFFDPPALFSGLSIRISDGILDGFLSELGTWNLELFDDLSPMACILALDEGTTSARAIVFDHDGEHPGRRAKGNPPDLIPSPAGSSTTRTKSGCASLRRPSKPSASAGLSARTSPPSASPISARRPSCGTARPASPSITRSSGRIAGRRECATACARTVARR